MPEEHSDQETPKTPLSPDSTSSSQASTPLDYGITSPDAIPKRVPSLRSVSDPSASNPMNPTSTPQGVLTQARGGPSPAPAASQLDLLAKAKAFQAERMKMASQSGGSTPASHSPRGTASPTGGFSAGSMNLRIPGGIAQRPGVVGLPRSDSAVPTRPGAGGGGLSARRGLKLNQMPGNPMSPSSGGRPAMKLQLPNGGDKPAVNGAGQGTRLSDFDKYIDSEKGWITFEGSATITKDGVNFANGAGFKISLDEVEILDELGKGNYGTVYKVRHARPKVPRFGLGLTGFRKQPTRTPSFTNVKQSSSASEVPTQNSSTGRVMAMKEIRLELDENKFKTILKELVILHACTSPFIIDFYGAFFQEGSVYMCIEYMDGGSVDQLYSGGVPEQVLRKITYATVMGLKYLKEKHNIIHRDVKPTNVLVNTKGRVKICDFGVSGNLVASLAKTQIGCQSYMAPERITQGNTTFSPMGGAVESTYSVSSDIWSLGLSVIECATGKYPYPPEVSSSILGQLNAIVEGEPSELPEIYSPISKDFVKSCLHKIPAMRPSYTDLLNHMWLAPFAKPETIEEEDEEDGELKQGMDGLKIDENSCSVETGDPEIAEWVRESLMKKLTLAQQNNGSMPTTKPALHTVNFENKEGLSAS